MKYEGMKHSVYYV